MIQDDYVNIFQVAMQKMSSVWLYDEKKGGIHTTNSTDQQQKRFRVIHPRHTGSIMDIPVAMDVYQLAQSFQKSINTREFNGILVTEKMRKTCHSLWTRQPRGYGQAQDRQNEDQKEHILRVRIRTWHGTLQMNCWLHGHMICTYICIHTC